MHRRRRPVPWPLLAPWGPCFLTRFALARPPTRPPGHRAGRGDERTNDSLWCCVVCGVLWRRAARAGLAPISGCNGGTQESSIFTLDPWSRDTRRTLSLSLSLSLSGDAAIV